MFAKLRAKHLLYVFLIGVPLVIFVLGIGGLTWLRPSSYVTITAPPSAAKVVMTGKNVLESTGESVAITARGPRDQDVFLAIGLTSDVQAFVSTIDHEVLADFQGGGKFLAKKYPGKKPNSANSEQTTAAGMQAPAHPAQNDAADIKKLDIWSQTASGKGQASLRWNLSDSRWSAVAFVGNQQKAPQLQLKWHREPSLAPAWFMTIIGGLALTAVCGYVTLSLISEMRSKARRLEIDEKVKTIRLAAEVTGEVESSSHPRRRDLRLAAQDSNTETAPDSPNSETTEANPETAEPGSDSEEANS